MYQPKVENTGKYSDSQGTHEVAPAKLILIQQEDNKEFPCVSTNMHGNDWMINEGLIRSPRKYYKPIIISETEEIITGNKVYNKKLGKIVRSKEDDRTAIEKNYRKILALPQHFSDKHLQAIVDGKLEDGDEVLIKLESYGIGGESCYQFHDRPIKETVNEIYLDQQNHITLFPVKQSLEEALKQEGYITDKELNDILEIPVKDMNEIALDIAKFGAEWAKKNNY